jgi:hypothetical protein
VLQVWPSHCECITSPLLRESDIVPARNLPPPFALVEVESESESERAQAVVGGVLAPSVLSDLSIRDRLLAQSRADGSLANPLNVLHGRICPGSGGRARSESNSQSESLDPLRRVTLAVAEMRRFAAAVDLMPPTTEGAARGFVNRTSAEQLQQQLVHAASHGLFSNASHAPSTPPLSSPFPTLSDHGVHLPYSSTTVLRMNRRK